MELIELVGLIELIGLIALAGQTAGPSPVYERASVRNQCLQWFSELPSVRLSVRSRAEGAYRSRKTECAKSEVRMTNECQVSNDKKRFCGSGSCGCYKMHYSTLLSVI